MRFTKLFVKNVERVDSNDAKQFKFTTDVIEEEPPANVFEADTIELLDNGWVFVVTREEGQDMCFPPWRVIALEDLIE